MKSIVTALALLALSTPAIAQEDAGIRKGQWDLDVKPFEGIGFGFQLSDRFSLRPLFGGVRPSDTGTRVAFGVDLRYELTGRTTMAPYLLGTLAYERNSSTETAANDSVSRIGTFGLGAGLRQPISSRWALFGELSFQHSTADFGDGVWNQFQLSDRDALRLGFGVTFTIKK